MLQKRAIRIVSMRSAFVNITSPLFSQSETLKFMDLVEFKTVPVTYKAKNDLLLDSIQNLSSERENGYDLRGELQFKTHEIYTT